MNARSLMLLAAVLVPALSADAFAGDVKVMFYKDGDAKVARRALKVRAGARAADVSREVLRELFRGPTAVEASQGLRSAFPAGTTLDALEIRGDAVIVTFGMDAPPPPSAVVRWDEMQTQAIHTLSALEPALREFRFAVRTGGRVVPLDEMLSIGRIPPPGGGGGVQRLRSDASPKGTLSGKRIAVSPGHGWYWTGSGWTTQRGDTGGLIEDFLTADICLHWLVPYLERAGAHVIVARDRDFQTGEVVLDNGKPGYVETGAWNDGASPGGWNNDYRVSQTSPSGGAEATYTVDVPAPGDYRFSIWFVAGANRVTDLPIAVSHTGGTTSYHVNQQGDGSTWVYFDPFHFAARAVVTFSNLSAGGGYAVADAVRLGGGTGSIDRGGGVSGKPRWQECARYFTQYSGAPTSVYQPLGAGAADNDNDVTSRPLFANWSGADLFLSVHTNAFDGSSTGTETYIYNGTATTGSDALRHLVNSQVVGDIRAEWDANWVDRGEKTANFGEVRAIAGMPAVLTELAFHDGVTGVPDNGYLHDARFKRLLGRALYRAVARYFDAATPVVTEPPGAVGLFNSGAGALAVSWAPVQGADGYRVYVSTDGHGFDDGTASSGATSHDLQGLPPGQTYFVRVTAVNSGGESFPSKTVAARVADARGWVPLLIVDHFDRLDDKVQIDDNPGAWMVPHAAAAAGAGYFFDGVTHDAIDAAAKLSPYRAVDWILGRQSTADGTFSSAEMGIVRTYLDNGGALFVSGTEVAWDLGAKGNPAEIAFLNDYLKVAYATDDSGTHGVEPAPGGIFEGVAPFSFDDGTHGTYNAAFPDTLTPRGSLQALLYAGGKGIAGVAHAAAFKVVCFGFPFETIYDDGAAGEVMGRVLKFLIGDIPAQPDGGTPKGDGGGDAETADAGGDAAEDSGADAGGSPPDAAADSGAGNDAGPDAGRVCNEGATRCISLGVESCIDGTWVRAAACGKGTVCSGGVCVPAPVDAGAHPDTASEAAGGSEGGCACTSIAF